jgi:hypothetical protein
MISCSGPLLRCEYERRGADFRKELELQISSIRFVASLWVFALLLCSAAAAHGAEATTAKPGHDFTRPGWYLNAMGRLQLENFSFDAKDVVSSGDTDSSAGFSFAGGYRINEFLATELQGEYLMDFFEDALQMGGAWLLGANVRAYYPLPWLDKRIQPVAIVGLSYFNAPLPDDYGHADALECIANSVSRGAIAFTPGTNVLREQMHGVIDNYAERYRGNGGDRESDLANHKRPRTEGCQYRHAVRNKAQKAKAKTL